MARRSSEFVAPGVELLYLDNHLLVVAKPAGMLTQADRTGDDDLLTVCKRFIKRRFDKPGAVYLGLVHRLDRPVSGVVVLARTSKSAARLTAQFKARSPVKRYAALVEGRVAEQLRLVHYLRKAKPRVRVYARERDGAKRAALTATPVWSGAGLSLLDVKLETGRPHQIRAQLSHVRHPILGDGRYGARQPGPVAADGGSALALHAYSLEVQHPTKKTPMAFTAPPPAHWPKPALSPLLELVG